MHFLNYFYNKNLKFDLINKFYYTNLKKLPKLKKIILNLSCKTINLKTLAINLLVLELITNQKGILTLSKQQNILLKIKKGTPTGCKLTLKKSLILNFLSRNLNETFPNIKNFNGIIVDRKIEKTSISFVIKNTLNFPELSEHYYLFNNLSNINLSLVTNIGTKKEMIFFFNSLQLPIKQ